MEVVNVKNVVIKYIPEHIVVETYVLSSNATTAEKNQQRNIKSIPNDDYDRPSETLDDLNYISMDESLNPDNDDEDLNSGNDNESQDFEEAQSSMKEFTEEEYLEIDDDYEDFIETVYDFENVECMEVEAKQGNQSYRKESTQLLKDWFFSHLSNPYPTEQEKESFCMLTKKSLVQINNWFTNMRKRNKDRITYCKSDVVNVESLSKKIKQEHENLEKTFFSKKSVQITTSSHKNKSINRSELYSNDSSQSHYDQLCVSPKQRRKKNTSQTPAICDVCGKTFAHRRMLQCHLKRHDPSKWEKCEICQKSFPDGLKRHMRTHSGERPFTCDQCGASYTQSFALKMHKASHDTSGDEYYCDICNNGKAFYNRFKFKYHVRSHFLEKTLRSCEICGFKTNNLKSHMITRHSTLRPFKCETCNETFKFKAVYRTHLLIHSESTPFACDLCDKKFKAEYSLVRHKVVHSEEKNFICTVCSKAFLLQRYLSKHMKGHTGTRKRHACTECSKDYSNVTDRRRHMEREHGIIEIPNPKYANNKMKKKTVVPC